MRTGRYKTARCFSGHSMRNSSYVKLAIKVMELGGDGCILEIDPPKDGGILQLSCGSLTLFGLRGPL